MHDELITALRTCVDKDKDCPECPYYERCMHASGKHAAMVDAADAIEELTATAESYKRSMEMWADEAARAQPRWIPVTERLPEEDCQVLAYYGFNRGDKYLGMMFMQVLDYYARDPKPHFQHEGLNGMTVTHWMPLPPAPEPLKEEA